MIRECLESCCFAHCQASTLFRIGMDSRYVGIIHHEIVINPSTKGTNDYSNESWMAWYNLVRRPAAGLTHKRAATRPVRFRGRRRLQAVRPLQVAGARRRHGWFRRRCCRTDLLHGAGDSDESWSSVGRAGFIFDNLSAAKNARPMVVVMTAGHINPPSTAAAPGAPLPDEFTENFVKDVHEPWFESRGFEPEARFLIRRDTRLESSPAAWRRSSPPRCRSC